ncbi:MAG TPA: hypothetical protein VH702_18200 [Vicinamibacterales bacterium]
MLHLRVIGTLLVAVAVVGQWTILPAFAQAKGAAESTAAARVDANWRVPRTAWGHPDLEGT